MNLLDHEKPRTIHLLLQLETHLSCLDTQTHGLPSNRGPIPRGGDLSLSKHDFICQWSAWGHLNLRDQNEQQNKIDKKKGEEKRKRYLWLWCPPAPSSLEIVLLNSKKGKKREKKRERKGEKRKKKSNKRRKEKGNFIHYAAREEKRKKEVVICCPTPGTGQVVVETRASIDPKNQRLGYSFFLFSCIIYFLML